MKYKKFLLGKTFYTLISSAIVIGIYFFTQQEASSVNPTGTFEDCRVVRVIDGDSVKVDCQGNVLNLRLLYIDAPEMKQHPWGNLAKDALVSQLIEPLQVSLDGRDVYNRHLAVIAHGNSEINLSLVEQGAVRVYNRYKPPKRYQRAMKSAKSQRLGIWKKGGLHQDPQRWRRLSQ